MVKFGHFGQFFGKGGQVAPLILPIVILILATVLVMGREHGLGGSDFSCNSWSEGGGGDGGGCLGDCGVAHSSWTREVI